MIAVPLLVVSLVAADAGQPASRGVLLDFTATWCGPCQQMNPIVSRLARQGYPVRKVDVDQERSLAQKYNVTRMPTFILVVDGKEQIRLVGQQSEAQLRRLLTQIPLDPKPTVDSRPDPRNIAQATPKPEIRVAANEQPAPSQEKSIFTFPFGSKQEAPEVPSEPAVIRAKLDQEELTQPVSIEENPLGSSVRVRITNEGGVNYGSGTILDSQAGRTVILTCGHIFRELKDDAKIEVDIFEGHKAETFVGKTIGYDLEGDVGLLSIATQTPIAASPVAGTAEEARVRQSVYSIGCGGGDPPSRQDVHVTALNRYLGPDNIECTGEPLQGRSGGGLFNEEGEVVGVCVAADPRDKRGLYAGLKVIHNLLREHKLEKLIPGPVASETPIIAKAEPEIPAEASANVAPPVKTAVAKGNDIVLPPGLETAGEAEVICIVRPLNQPKSASQVVIINRASTRFVSYLTQEIQDQPVPTMHQERAQETLPFAKVQVGKPAIVPPPADFTEQAPIIERYQRRR
jgi:thiol-disulfide isomerase/thioredoxin